MGPSPRVGLSVGLSVSAIGGERRLSGELNSMPGPGTMSVRVSPPQPILSRGRPDKVALSPHPKISLLPLRPPTSLPRLTPLSAPSPRKTENRRITHISAEQKRRFNIKLGFDTLHGLVSTLSTQPSLKVSPQPRVVPPGPQGSSWTPYIRPNLRTLQIPSCLLPLPSA